MLTSMRSPIMYDPPSRLYSFAGRYLRQTRLTKPQFYAAKTPRPKARAE